MCHGLCWKEHTYVLSSSALFITLSVHLIFPLLTFSLTFLLSVQDSWQHPSIHQKCSCSLPWKTERWGMISYLWMYAVSCLFTSNGKFYYFGLDVFQEEVLFGLKFSSLTIMRQTAFGYPSSPWFLFFLFNLHVQPLLLMLYTRPSSLIWKLSLEHILVTD